MVAGALRQGVSLQIFAADGDTFRFRHALTHEAVLGGLLPPERAQLAYATLGSQPLRLELAVAPYRS